MEPNFKFKRSESFVLRNGWAQKALLELEKPDNEATFSKNDGVVRLGVGSNMVTSIKYWLQAAGIIEDNKGRGTRLTDFGKLISQYDRFFESSFVWQLVHFNMATNMEDCPLFYLLFEETSISYTFSKDDFVSWAADYLQEKFPEVSFNKKYLEDDTSVMTRTYTKSNDWKDPEDDSDSPLSRLGLLQKIANDKYKKTRIKMDGFDSRVFFFVLKKTLGRIDHIEASDAYAIHGGPASLFNLDQTTFMSLLASLHNLGFITMTKTAGLNMVYINPDKMKYSIKDLFADHFEEKKQ